MTGKGAKNKGSRGEREFLKKLGDLINLDLKRNLNQTRTGGADCKDLPGFSIEIKYQSKYLFKPWWDQCVSSAKGLKPLLAYRITNQRTWWIVIRACDLCKKLKSDKPVWLEMETFANLYNSGVFNDNSGKC